MYLFYKEHETYEPSHDSLANLVEAFLGFVYPDLDLESISWEEKMGMFCKIKGAGFIKLPQAGVV